ncbi:hypothetical protein PG994_007076 [Apiospora phragmitis]|uniref:C2H2-type domain-containing protein n=1 Tax=Apiospora phragmitis TaxID=2905665 RepID=A0ABR1UZR5_9PEZI
MSRSQSPTRGGVAGPEQYAAQTTSRTANPKLIITGQEATKSSSVASSSKAWIEQQRLSLFSIGAQFDDVDQIANDLHDPHATTCPDDATLKGVEADSQSPSINSSQSEQTAEESDIEFLSESHPFMLALPAILRDTLPRFIEWANRYAGTQRVGGKDASHQGSADKGKATASSSKRKFVPYSSGPGDQDEVADEDLEGNKRRRKATPNDDDDEGPLLACPFYKKDKLKHSNCLTFRLKRIKDVKQHLTRKHSQPQFCARCGDPFDTQEILRNHTRYGQCSLADFEAPEGVTEDQKRYLANRVSRKLPLIEQWYQVWDILFHPLGRPSTPFIESPTQEFITGFREFWAENGQDIVAEHIQGRDELPHSVLQEERDLASLHAIVQQVVTSLVHRYIHRHNAWKATGDSQHYQHSHIPEPVPFNTNQMEHDLWTDSGTRPHYYGDLTTFVDSPVTTIETSQRDTLPNVLDDAANAGLETCIDPTVLVELDEWLRNWYRENQGNNGTN